MNTNEPIKRPEDFMAGFTSALKALIEARERELRDFLSGVPQRIECKQHPGRERSLSFKLSWDETVKRHGRHTAVYEPCVLCIEEARLRLENNRLANFGVPPLLMDCSFERWDDPNDPNMLAVRDFATNQRRGFLLIIGPPGTGKSHLAVSAMRFFSHAWFVRHYQFMRMLRTTYSDKNAQDPVEQAVDADLLVFDDLGVSVRGTDEMPAIHQIIEHRYEHQFPTIITSNLTTQQIAEWIGPRMTDRIRHALAQTIKLTGESKRPSLRDDYMNL